jgi:hypothetical protein
MHWREGKTQEEMAFEEKLRFAGRVAWKRLRWQSGVEKIRVWESMFQSS